MISTNWDADISRINSYLKRKSCVFTRAWLEECVEYYKSEQSGAINADQLSASVMEQWCLVDLREFSIATLPPQLASQTKVELTGNYALQVDISLDISKSAYTQHQQLQHAEVGNLAVDEERRAEGPAEPKARRMMQLELTDGVQRIRAVEHRPIKMFDRTLVPGCKVLVSGPVLCRRGILYLCTNNISLLGGEVDSLLVPNALENVLARRLRLPENPDPYRMQPADAGTPAVAVTPAVTQDEWGDDDWEQDLALQLPEILTAADNLAYDQRANNDGANRGNNANGNQGNNAIANYSNSGLGNRDSNAFGSRANETFGNHGHNAFGSRGNNSSTNSGSDAFGNRGSVEFGNRGGNSSLNRRNDAYDDHGNEPFGNYGNNSPSSCKKKPFGYHESDNCRSRVNQAQGSNSGYPEDEDDWSPPRPVKTETLLSDSEDEFLQAVDVEAALRMTQQPRPTKRQTERAEMEENPSQRIEFLPHWQQARAREAAFEELRARRQKPRLGEAGSSKSSSFKPSQTYRPAATQEDADAGRKLAAEEAQRPMECDRDAGDNVTHDRHFGTWSEPMDQGSPLAKHEKPDTQRGWPQTFESEPIDSELPRPETFSSKGPRIPMKVEAEPFVYLSAVDASQRGTRFIVKATVLQLRSSLKVQAGRWHLLAEIADGSAATLVVSFANTVLETLTGFSVPEVVVMKKQMVTNPLIKERIHGELQHARQRLLDLNCLMTLQVEEDSVQVVALAKVEEKHRALLANRISNATRDE